MADLIRVEGVPPYDGEYEINLDEFFNGNELHFIKQRSGVRAGELEEAFAAGDYDVQLAFAVIAVERSGRHERVDADIFWKAAVGKIQFVADEQEEEPRPPDTPTPSGSRHESESPPSDDENKHSSGSISRPAGDPLANGQSPTGSPPSEPSATLGSVTSA